MWISTVRKQGKPRPILPCNQRSKVGDAAARIKKKASDPGRAWTLRPRSNAGLSFPSHRPAGGENLGMSPRKHLRIRKARAPTKLGDIKCSPQMKKLKLGHSTAVKPSSPPPESPQRCLFKKVPTATILTNNVICSSFLGSTIGAQADDVLAEAGGDRG